MGSPTVIKVCPEMFTCSLNRLQDKYRLFWAPILQVVKQSYQHVNRLNPVQLLYKFRVDEDELTFACYVCSVLFTFLSL